MYILYCTYTYTYRNVVNVYQVIEHSSELQRALLRLKITELVILQTNNCAINFTVKYVPFYTLNYVYNY